MPRLWRPKREDLPAHRTQLELALTAVEALGRAQASETEQYDLDDHGDMIDDPWYLDGELRSAK